MVAPEWRIEARKLSNFWFANLPSTLRNAIELVQRESTCKNSNSNQYRNTTQFDSVQVSFIFGWFAFFYPTFFIWWGCMLVFKKNIFDPLV